jgi:hypothetical protein
MQLSKEAVIHEVDLNKEQTIILRTNNNKEKDAEETANETITEYKMEIVWPNVFVYIIFHCMAIYGFYLGFTVAKWGTIAWGKYFFSQLELLLFITAGQLP